MTSLVTIEGIQMSSLADLPELVGFFSYSREDDKDSDTALSALRKRIQGELRGQLGRTTKTFRLWQDKQAIPPGTLWESEIKSAVAQSVFFIPIITPTVVASSFCQLELEFFLAREAALGRDDLVFPILYIDVPALEDSLQRQNDPVLSLIAKRKLWDWREIRYLDINSTDARREMGRFCKDVRDALRRSWLSPEEREQREEAAARQQAEAERQRQDADRAKEHARQSAAEEDRRKREASSEVIAPKIFFSFASEDRPFVSTFTQDAWFTSQLGNVAVQDFKLGDNLDFGELNQWIDEHVYSAAAVIVFLSKYYMRKQYPFEEFIKTISEFRRRRLIFIPIVLDADAKLWWVDLRRKGNLNVLPDDFRYSDFTQGGTQKYRWKRCSSSRNRNNCASYSRRSDTSSSCDYSV
jgi:hypothetical protein